MAYSTAALAQDAVASLKPILAGLKTNNLDAYITGQMRKDFITDEGKIRSALDQATKAAYDVQQAEAEQNAARAEDTNYTNTKNAVAEMRRNLVGSGSSGANVGAANATALQALLGLGQQNTEVTTEGLQAVNNVSKERAAQMAQNAVESINMANDATDKMYGAGTSAYNSDRSYAAQGAAEALAQLGAAADTAASNERQTAETNAANERMNAATAAANVQAAKASANGNSTQTVISVDGGKKSTKKSTKKSSKKKKK